MILVDASVWIDHLHATELDLVDLLNHDLVVTHPSLIEELALGSIRRRDEVIGLLSTLTHLPVLRHGELLTFVDRHRLWGRGLSAIDVHVLGSARLAGASLWTRHKRLGSAAAELGLATRS